MHKLSEQIREVKYVIYKSAVLRKLHVISLNIVRLLLTEAIWILNYKETHRTATVGTVSLASTLTSQKFNHARSTVSVAAKSGHFFVLKRHQTYWTFFLFEISDFTLPLILHLCDSCLPWRNKSIPELVSNLFICDTEEQTNQNAIGNEWSKQN